jgi:hypothetical protein
MIENSYIESALEIWEAGEDVLLHQVKRISKKSVLCIS